MTSVYRAAILLMLGAAPAAAQDDWAGIHLGAALVTNRAQLGAQGDLRDDLDQQGIDAQLFSPSGEAAALRVGRDWQYGNLVLGIAAEYQTGSADAGADDARIAELLMQAQVSLTRNARLFGRIGYAAGDWMPYALAGQDVARLHISGAAQASGDIRGNSLGLGLEHRVNPQISTFAEYSQTQFDPLPGAEDQLDLSRKDLRVGASFRF